MIQITRGRDRPKVYSTKSNHNADNVYPGYRMMGYDAEFEQTKIELVDKHVDGFHVIEMEDMKSGLRLMVSIREEEK